MIDLGVHHLSQVGGISLSSVLYSVKSLDFFVAITTTTSRLLTQSVGSSRSSRTPMSVSLSSSALSFGLMVNGIRRDGAILGGTEGSTLTFCSPSSVPTLPSNTSLYSSMISWAVWVFLLVTEVVVAVATCCGYLFKVFFMYFDELHLLYHFGT